MPKKHNKMAIWYVISAVLFDVVTRSVVNTFSANTIVAVKVKDTVAGRDGEDIVLGVEKFRFSNGNGGTQDFLLGQILQLLDRHARDFADLLCGVLAHELGVLLEADRLGVVRAALGLAVGTDGLGAGRDRDPAQQREEGGPTRRHRTPSS